MIPQHLSTSGETECNLFNIHFHIRGLILSGFFLVVRNVDMKLVLLHSQSESATWSARNQVKARQQLLSRATPEAHQRIPSSQRCSWTLCLSKWKHATSPNDRGGGDDSFTASLPFILMKREQFDLFFTYSFVFFFSLSLITSKNATMMAPTMTKAELRTAHRMREMDSPPGSVNFSISGRTLRKVPLNASIAISSG